MLTLPSQASLERRGVPRMQPVEQGYEQRLEIVGGVEDLTHHHSKLADRGLTLRALDAGAASAGVVSYHPRRVVNPGDQLRRIGRHTAE